jgi:hypothetical protein
MAGDQVPVLVAALDLAALPAVDDSGLAGFQISGDAKIVLPGKVGRHEEIDVAADQLVDGVAEERFDGRVGDFDNALAVDGNDGIDQRVDDAADAGIGLPVAVDDRGQVLDSPAFRAGGRARLR